MAAPPGTARPGSVGMNWIIPALSGSPSIFTSPATAWRGRSSVGPPQPAIKAAAAQPDHSEIRLTRPGMDMLAPHGAIMDVVSPVRTGSTLNADEIDVPWPNGRGEKQECFPVGVSGDSIHSD